MLELSKSKNDIIINILKKYFRTKKVEKSGIDKEDDKGIDWVVNYNTYVDSKIRRRKYPGDVALETFSNLESGKLGWTRDFSKKTHFILWLWTDKYLVLDYKYLRKVFIREWKDWKVRFRVCQQTTNNSYHSEIIFVPVTFLCEQIIYERIYNP